MTRQTFFEDAIAKRDLGHHLLEFPVLRAEVLDLITGGIANRVPRQLLLACFEEVLAPPVVEVGCDPLSPAQLGDTLLATEAFFLAAFFLVAFFLAAFFFEAFLFAVM
jgi:hypothetical protein